MGEPRPHPPVLLLLAAFSRHESALAWARHRATTAWGPLWQASPVFDFVQTDYYNATMGPGLKKILLAFEHLIDPAQLVAHKHQTNRWEQEYAQQHPAAETRPLNLDPGYLSEAKLVLATTKDRNHRLYLEQGIFAEVTLHYQRKHGWSPQPWTYADYRLPAYHEFFDRCRQFLRSRIHAS